MMGTVQSVALKGRPGHRSWWRGREVRASPEDMQELLPTPLEMHKDWPLSPSSSSLDSALETATAPSGANDVTSVL
ncbi:Glutamate receptor-interacting protein 2 [Manis javanica]|nr:Glutamate receptor-interacting protein 2 [Manis javanica]